MTAKIFKKQKNEQILKNALDIFDMKGVPKYLNSSIHIRIYKKDSKGFYEELYNFNIEFYKLNKTFKTKPTDKEIIRYIESNEHLLVNNDAISRDKNRCKKHTPVYSGNDGEISIGFDALTGEEVFY